MALEATVDNPLSTMAGEREGKETGHRQTDRVSAFLVLDRSRSPSGMTPLSPCPQIQNTSHAKYTYCLHVSKLAVLHHISVSVCWSDRSFGTQMLPSVILYNITPSEATFHSLLRGMSFSRLLPVIAPFHNISLLQFSKKHT